MAVQAVVVATLRAVAVIHGLHHGLVTTKTRVFHNIQTVFFNNDGIFEVLQSERRGMTEAVQGLDGIFAHDVVRKMTVIAFGHMMVRGLLPGIEIVLHDVAVDAGAGVV